VTTDEILKAMGPLVHDGKLACRDALELAARLGIKPALIGKTCNKNDIRIINCQLGCFGAVPKRRND
jgi:hypothetical protein